MSNIDTPENQWPGPKNHWFLDKGRLLNPYFWQRYVVEKVGRKKPPFVGSLKLAFFNIDWILEVEISFAWLLVHVLTAWFLLHLLHLYLLCQRHSGGEEWDILTWFWKNYCRSDWSFFVVHSTVDGWNPKANHLGSIKPFENNGINDISSELQDFFLQRNWHIGACLKAF